MRQPERRGIVHNFDCRYRLRPRMLRDTTNTDTSTTVLGHRINFPVAVAPTAFHCMAHHDGESGTARGEGLAMLHVFIIILLSQHALLLVPA